MLQRGSILLTITKLSEFHRVFQGQNIQELSDVDWDTDEA